jgi:hypothetical protein
MKAPPELRGGAGERFDGSSPGEHTTEIAVIGWISGLPLK